MPAKGFSSHIIEPNKFVAPQDLDLLLKGTMYKEELAKNNLQNIQSTVQQLASIPAYGKDAEVVQSKMEELRNSVSNMKLGNLGDHNTMNQINGVISQYANDPDLLDIAQRWTPYVQEVKRNQKLQEEGKAPLTSPLLDDAEDYLRKGETIKGTRFGKAGWLNPEIQKYEKEALANVKTVKKNVKVGNQIMTVETPDEDDLRIKMNEIYSRPEIRQDMEYKAEREAKRNGTTFSDIARQDLTKKLQDAQMVLNLDPANTEAQSYIDQYSSILNSPERLEAIGKNKYIKSRVDEQVKQAIAAKNFESEGDLKYDELFVKGVEHSNRLIEKQYDVLAKGAAIMGYSVNEVLRDPNKQKTAMEAAQKADMETYSEKQKIKLENTLAIKEKMAKLGFKDVKDDTNITYQYVTDDGSMSAPVNEQWKETKNKIKKGDPKVTKSIVAGILTANGTPTSPSDVTVSGTGENRVIKVNSSWFDGEAERVVSVEVMNLDNFTKNNTNQNTNKSFDVNSVMPVPGMKVAQQNTSEKVDNNNPLLK